MNDQNQRFLRKFLNLYKDLLAHEGYGDLSINIRLVNNQEKEVRLFCGREYKFRVRTAGPDGYGRRGRLSFAGMATSGTDYDGPERRSGRDRRESVRRIRNEPRHFKLERRVSGERRSGRGRRRDD